MRALWLVRTSSLYFHNARVYVTRVHCWNIMHAAYVIGMSAPNSRYILGKKLKKLVPRALLSYKSTWEFLRTLEKFEKYEKHEPKVSASLHFSRVPEIPACL